MTALSYLTVDISNCFGKAWLPFDFALDSHSLYSLALYMAQVQIVFWHISYKCSTMFLDRSPGVGCGLWGLVGCNVAPTFASFTLSFDNCLAKPWASLYRQLASMHMCCIFMLKLLLLTYYTFMVLYFASTIIKLPLSTIALCVFGSKLAQGSASMYYIIHIEHQQGINVALRKPYMSVPKDHMW